MLMSDTNKAKVPVTIITGFLGSGKTTLLQHVLTEYHGKKIAVIQNEFGDTSGLEYAMITENNKSEQFEYIEFLNGCMCCSSKGELTLAIEKIIQKNHFDHIFIETSGLADPRPIITSLWVDDELKSDIYLNGTIAIIDSKNIDINLKNYETTKQLIVADYIIFNKIDLIDDGKCVLLKNKISKINCLAKIIYTSHSRVDLDSILNIHAYDTSKEYILSDIINNTNSIVPCIHDEKIRSVSIIIEANIISKSVFEKWLGDLLWNDSQSSQTIIRIKGVISINNKIQKYAVQAIYELFEVKSMNINWIENESYTSKLIFIGKKLDKIALQKSIEKLTI
jgi:G3E family GTPase